MLNEMILGLIENLELRALLFTRKGTWKWRPKSSHDWNISQI